MTRGRGRADLVRARRKGLSMTASTDNDRTAVACEPRRGRLVPFAWPGDETWAWEAVAAWSARPRRGGRGGSSLRGLTLVALTRPSRRRPPPGAAEDRWPGRSSGEAFLTGAA